MPKNSKPQPKKVTIHRSSVNGRFVPKKFAQTHLKTTETERVRKGN